MLYVLVVVWMVKKLFVAFGEGDKEVEYTAMEKENESKRGEREVGEGHC